MASTAAGSNLFSHIRYLMITTVPSFIITLIIYIIYGIFGEHTIAMEETGLSNALHDNYNITPLLLIVPLITFFLMIKKVPAIIVIFISVILGSVAAIMFQPENCLQISGHETMSFASRITGVIKSIYGSVTPATGHDTLNELVKTKGMRGMLNTIWLIICAMACGGAM